MGSKLDIPFKYYIIFNDNFCFISYIKCGNTINKNISCFFTNINGIAIKSSEI